MRDVVQARPSFPPAPEPLSPALSPQVKVPADRPTCSNSSSTQSLILGVDGSSMHYTGANSTSSVGLAPPVLPAVTITSPTASSTCTHEAAPTSASTTTSTTTSLISSLISRSLTLYDSLRVPRCTAFQLLSNGGFMSQNDPATIEQIRRHGFEGTLPGPTAGPWSLEFQKWYFKHDARAEAAKALELASAMVVPM